MADEQPEAKYILEEMEVDTIGLVQSGANMEKFLLLKAQESTMPDELLIEEVTTEDSPDPSFVAKANQWLQGILKAKAKKMDPGKVAMAAKILGMTPAALAEALGGEMEEEMEMGDKKVKKGSPPEGEEKVVDTPVTKSIEAELAELQKAQEARFAELEKALTARYEGQITELQKKAEAAQAEVEKARVEAEKAVAERERREWIEKAESMTLALPVKKDELAEHLYAISKAIPTEIEWLTSLLKAADHNLTEAGLFSEFGTSRTEQVEAVEKAEQIAKDKNIPLAEAILQLSPDEQAEIAKQFLEGGE